MAMPHFIPRVLGGTIIIPVPGIATVSDQAVQKATVSDQAVDQATISDQG